MIDIAGIKPSEMGIPHGNGMQRQNIREQMSRNQNTQSRSPIRSNNNDFLSFEDTFKPVKKPGKANKVGNSAWKQPLHTSTFIDKFDNTPIPSVKN